MTIRITRYDGELCLAEVDGSSVALVSRSDAMDLVEGRTGHRAGCKAPDLVCLAYP